MEKTHRLEQWHLFKKGNKNFVFAVKNLRLYTVDDRTFEEFENLQAKYGFDSFQTVDLSSSLVMELIEEGLIVCSEDLQEDENEKINYSSSSLPDDFKPVVSGLVLELANDCNLNCVYCYGQGGSYGRKRELMSFETAKKGIDWMVANSEDVDELHITFFGGEPLMNFPVMKQITEYCRELSRENGKRFRFNMTTNGTIMNDDIYDFLKKEKVSTMISMDGGRELQDKYRPYEKSNKSSYDDIVTNIPRFLDLMGGSLSVRATVCNPELDYLKIKMDLSALGFTQVNMTVVDIAPTSSLFVGNQSSHQILNEYDRLANDLIEKIKEGHPYQIHAIWDILQALYHKHIRIRSCNAGRNGFALGTDGNIYACQRFMGMENYIIGNIDTGVQPRELEQYYMASVFTKEDCTSCWARFVCGGGCTHTCVTQGGSVNAAPVCYCDIYRGQIETALYVYEQLKEWKPDIFQKLFEKDEQKQTGEITQEGKNNMEGGMQNGKKTIKAD